VHAVETPSWWFLFHRIASIPMGIWSGV
jgi:hypothetical protein